MGVSFCISTFDSKPIELGPLNSIGFQISFSKIKALQTGNNNSLVRNLMMKLTSQLNNFRVEILDKHCGQLE